MDSYCPGRSVVAATMRTTDAMTHMVEEYGPYTSSQIADTKGISEGTVHHIQNDHLKLKMGTPFVDT